MKLYKQIYWRFFLVGLVVLIPGCSKPSEESNSANGTESFVSSASNLNENFRAIGDFFLSVYGFDDLAIINYRRAGLDENTITNLLVNYHKQMSAKLDKRGDAEYQLADQIESNNSHSAVATYSRTYAYVLKTKAVEHQKRAIQLCSDSEADRIASITPPMPSAEEGDAWSEFIQIMQRNQGKDEQLLSELEVWLQQYPNTSFHQEVLAAYNTISTSWQNNKRVQEEFDKGMNEVNQQIRDIVEGRY